MYLVPPITLLNHNRFDLPLKFLYAKSFLSEYDTTYYHDLYEHHLQIWNNFKEYNNPNKNTFEAFKNTFEALITEIAAKGYDLTKEPVPVQDNMFLLNGAHRAAAALASSEMIACKVGKDREDGQLNCDYKFFLKKGLDSYYADRVALEYAKLKDNTHLIMLMPSATSKGSVEKVDAIAESLSCFYSKTIQLNDIGLFNLMREIYAGEEWAGNAENNYQGYRNKAQFCSGPSMSMKVYICKFENLEQALTTKEQIREIYNIGKHSVHINDTHEETLRLSKVLFNRNSIQHLNNAKTVAYEQFNSCLSYFKDYISDEGFNADDYCVTASSTLSIYGLREGRDLDYLHHHSAGEITGNDLLQSHNAYSIGRYPTTIDDIIYNPDNHFYSQGIKFAAPNIVRELKAKRNEPKDIKDIELLDTIV